MAGPLTADQVEARRPEWIWPVQHPGAIDGALDGRIAKGVLHVIAGPADKGKGLMVTKIGADLVKAGHRVLHSAIEDDPSLMTKPRYEAAGVTGYQQTVGLDRMLAQGWKFFDTDAWLTSANVQVRERVQR